MKKIDSKISTQTEKSLEESINVESLKQKLEEKLPEVEKRGGYTYSELEQMNQHERWLVGLSKYTPFEVHPLVPKMRSNDFFEGLVDASEVWDYLEGKPEESTHISAHWSYHDFTYDNFISIYDLNKIFDEYKGEELEDYLNDDLMMEPPNYRHMGDLWVKLVDLEDCSDWLYSYCSETGRDHQGDEIDEDDDDVHFYDKELEYENEKGETVTFTAEDWVDECHSIRDHRLNNWIREMEDKDLIDYERDYLFEYQRIWVLDEMEKGEVKEHFDKVIMFENLDKRNYSEPKTSKEFWDFLIELHSEYYFS